MDGICGDTVYSSQEAGTPVRHFLSAQGRSLIGRWAGGTFWQEGRDQDQLERHETMVVWTTVYKLVRSGIFPNI